MYALAGRMMGIEHYEHVEHPHHPREPEPHLGDAPPQQEPPDHTPAEPVSSVATLLRQAAHMLRDPEDAAAE